ncbi:MAG: SpoIID/LytB domain-containing protein [Myxococcota bacterium]
MRVRIATAKTSVAVAGKALAVDGRPVAGELLRASVRGGALQIGSRSYRSPVTLSARGGLRLDGRALPGKLRLLPRPSGGFDVVNVVPLEAYVASSVASETPASWPKEALRAQAVVARSYALHERARRANEPFDLEGSVISQRYAVGAVRESARSAARSTSGQVLVHGGRPILAAFHSSSGGATASAAEVWGEDITYLHSVSSPDDAAPDYFWSYEIALPDLAAALREAGYAPGRVGDVRITERSASGRVLVLQVGALELAGRDLREVLGGRALRSAKFDARIEGERVRFLGSGSGHGVGLCQWGASELARRGRSYRQILAHYYPGTNLRRVGAPGPVAGDWSATR